MSANRLHSFFEAARLRRQTLLDEKSELNGAKMASTASGSGTAELPTGHLVEQFRLKDGKITADVEDFDRQLFPNDLAAQNQLESTATLEIQSNLLRLLVEVNELVDKVSARKDPDKTSVEVLVQIQDISSIFNKAGCRQIHSQILQNVRHVASSIFCQLSQSLEETLEQVGWPSDTGTSPPIDMNNPTMKKIEFLLETMAKTSSLLENGDGTLEEKVAMILMKPVRTKFIFHFTGDQKTNRIEKPEWCYTHVLNTVRLNEPFLHEVVAPALQKQQIVPSLQHQGIAEVFVQQLIGLVTVRLQKQLPDICPRWEVFSHVIDETILLQLELLNLGYSVDCLTEFAKEPVLQTWISIEQVCNTERAEGLLTSDSAWNSRYQNSSDVDEFKVPEFGDDFLVLLQLITDRYRLLSDPVAQLKFLTVQLDLLDDFRVRIVQLTRNIASVWEEKFFKILNAITYINIVLTEWNDLPFFLRLQSFRLSVGHRGKDLLGTDRSRPDADGPFSGVISLFEHVGKEMCEALVVALISSLQDSAKPYLSERWYQMNVPMAGATPTVVTASFSPFLLRLREFLTLLKSSLSGFLFAKILPKFVDGLDQWFCGSMLTDLRVNEAGAVQLLYDFKTTFLPLVRSYGVVVERHFQKFIAILSLISLSVASLSLLRQSLVGLKDEGSYVKDNFPEFAVTQYCSDSDILRYLSLRIDVSPLGRERDHIYRH